MAEKCLARWKVSYFHAMGFSFSIIVRDVDISLMTGSRYQYRRHLNNDKVGGEFYLNIPNSTSVASVYINGVFGNPTIQFDSTIGADPNILIDLSLADVTPYDSKYFVKSVVKVQEIRLTRDLSLSICASLREPGNPINPVFALYDGVYWIHDPRFVSEYLSFAWMNES
jgi:hypothetical protein